MYKENIEKPIRILHVLTRMDYGGTETLLMNIYRKIDRNKIQFDFAVSSTTDAPYDNEIKKLGGKIYHYPKYLVKNHAIYCDWWNEFFQKYGDEYYIVHGHVGSTAAIYLSIAKKYNKYVIAHSHDTNEPIKNIKSIAYRLYSYPTRFIADAFLGCSLDALKDRFGKKILSKKLPCYILYNGIDVKKFKFNFNTRNELRKELGINQDTFVLGHIGRYTKQKNPIFILNVFACIRNMNNNVKLLYIGKGEMEKEIDREIDKLGITNDVIRIKETPNIEKYLCAMDVFIFPSVFEGLGIVTIEAQASGLNVVASSKVPIETSITDLIEYISLNQSAEKWAKRIMSIQSKERKQYNNIVENSNFNIEKTTNFIFDFYLNCYKRKEKFE